MNMKAMGKIAELNCVNNLFIGGSSSDRSLAISSGICMLEDINIKNKKKWNSKNFQELKLYI